MPFSKLLGKVIEIFLLQLETYIKKQTFTKYGALQLTMEINNITEKFAELANKSIYHHLQRINYVKDILTIESVWWIPTPNPRYTNSVIYTQNAISPNKKRNNTSHAGLSLTNSKFKSYNIVFIHQNFYIILMRILVGSKVYEWYLIHHNHQTQN